MGKYWAIRLLAVLLRFGAVIAFAVILFVAAALNATRAIQQQQPRNNPAARRRGRHSLQIGVIQSVFKRFFPCFYHRID